VPFTTTKSAFWAGFRDSAPFVVVAGPFALLFGVLATEAGLNVFEALAFSVVVVAGAAQFTALSLLQDDVPTLIVLASLWYTNRLAGEIADQERKKVRLWANAYKHFNQASPDSDLGFLFDVIKNNETVPVILTDEAGAIKAWRNFDSLRVTNDPAYLQAQLAQMQESGKKIAVEITPGQQHFIYYKDSMLLAQLRYFPFIQMGIIAVFLAVAYMAFNTSRRAEQNRLWVGMAKETAHQLGTPISSLLAWLENLRELSRHHPPLAPVIAELEKDVDRLELITERFSKIGSTPTLTEHDLQESLQRNVAYIRRRASGLVKIEMHAPDGAILLKFNPPLFDWVLENLLKNALDAIEGKGAITLHVQQADDEVIIDVQDSGKGIPKANFNSVFEPGFSTKKRGWGVGLTLTKRIVQRYHNGKIFVKDSALGKGATFRIVLPKGGAGKGGR